MQAANGDESLVSSPVVFMYKHTPPQLHTMCTHDFTPHAFVQGCPLSNPPIGSNECGVIKHCMRHHTNLSIEVLI